MIDSSETRHKHGGCYACSGFGRRATVLIGGVEETSDRVIWCETLQQNYPHAFAGCGKFEREPGADDGFDRVTKRWDWEMR